MQFPPIMKKYEKEIEEISKYLTAERNAGRFNDIDQKKLEGLFAPIIRDADKEISDTFIEGFTEIFMVNIKNLYREVGEYIAVHDTGFIATITCTCMMNVLNAIANAEGEENEAVTWQ